ncbi:MAG TPA: hypothetical protein VFA04_07225 [Bryobacteraceae bacterium]|jgi:hypothetical protein|nr:hypothetical protein [Bryobacteraceae bacterium]
MTRKHEHFETEQWTDFVRGHASAVLSREMEAHLDQGCDPCRRTADLWRRVAELARREEMFETPADDVRCAKALYSIFPVSERRSLRLRFAQWMGAVRPVLEGVRGAEGAARGIPARHYRFHEGNVILDLHIESTTAPGKMFMVGEIVDPDAAEPLHPGSAVTLKHGTETLAETALNAFGEFYLEFVPRPNLLLKVALEEASFLLVRVPDAEEAP